MCLPVKIYQAHPPLGIEEQDFYCYYHHGWLAPTNCAPFRTSSSSCHPHGAPRRHPTALGLVVNSLLLSVGKRSGTPGSGTQELDLDGLLTNRQYNLHVKLCDASIESGWK